MSTLKKYTDKDVLTASRERISYTFDNFEKIVLSFSGGKDSSVMFHLVMDEAIKRNRKVALMLIDLEAQYHATVKHAEEMFDKYKDYIELHWVCLPLSLRNAASNFEPRWICWDEDKQNDWVRDMPTHNGVININNCPYDFFHKGMEFEEFVVLFAEWYGKGENTCVFVGIRADESLNRFRTIASSTKEMYDGKRFTTKIVNNIYNVYPIYDWKTKDIWVYHALNKDKEHNKIYDLMHMAGVKPSQQRLCQPYGDDQRRGLWLYHILDPDSWYKVVARVNGVNSCALYIGETGNVNGYNRIKKPDGHTYKSFVNLLLSTMPEKTRDHYIVKFKTFLTWWAKRGYHNGIPDEAPKILEDEGLAPSWRRLAKVLLRNDWWCKGLKFSQPSSEAYGMYLQMKKAKKAQQ